MTRPLASLERLADFWAEARHEIATNGGHPSPLTLHSVLLTCLLCVLLTVFYYYARTNFYHRHLSEHVVPLLGMTDSPFKTLLPYAYWAMASFTVRILVPLGCIVFWLKEHPREYGFRLWKRGHGPIYLGMYLFMLPLLIGVSFLPSFQKKYPFYANATDSIWHFLSYELFYGIQFAGVEAFFRGFMVFALFKRFGYNAVLIMTIPYCMIHFNKPVPETLGSIIAGLALGFMAIHSRSWIPGALLHWSIGFTMDIVCIWHKWDQLGS